VTDIEHIRSTFGGTINIDICSTFAASLRPGPACVFDRPSQTYLKCGFVLYVDCLLKRRQGCEDKKLPRQHIRVVVTRVGRRDCPQAQYCKSNKYWRNGNVAVA
jgi:hypothetical protein